MPEALPQQPAPAGRARVFFALWPDAATAARLGALARGLCEHCGGRAMRRDTLHLTLAFVGDVERERLEELQRIGAALSGAAFGLRLDRVGAWQNKRIVWVAPTHTPPVLAELAASLAGALRAAGYALEARAYAPHITLLRNAARPPMRENVDAFEWRIGGFALLESLRLPAGARYRKLGAWRLGAAKADAGF